MFQVEIRPSLRIVKQISAIDRYSGIWSRKPVGIITEADEFLAQISAARAICALDPTLSYGTQRAIEKSFVSPNGGESALASVAEERVLVALRQPLVLETRELSSLHDVLVGNASNESPLLRTTPINFVDSLGQDQSKAIVFPTVRPFLIRQRFGELVDWMGEESVRGNVHPLFLSGIFHLLLLQTSPFPIANHALALVMQWQYVVEHGYDFLRKTHLAPIFQERAEAYFAALRQAEKSAFTTWATLNIWLEFYLDCLQKICEQLSSTENETVEFARLTSVQQKIVHAVTEHGASTREKIANETGINLSTVKYNLSVLTERGYLKRIGGGRTTSYQIS